ncbi:hypothetical protein ZWY2020_020615 [Hordeum vulgare]|nr:hypothetical protein ZWY2020_020615 [Hordeum vulgare]
MNKYNSSRHAQSEEEEKVVERLKHLLMRAGTMVEEADTRYITNSGMMMQLKTLSEAMYQGYGVLDNSRYRDLQGTTGFDEVSIKDSSASSLYLAKRSRTIPDKDARLESHVALESLEIVVANMAEFIVLLGGWGRATAWMTVPTFGDWDMKNGAIPDYSMDFSKIREMYKQNKKELSRASLSGDDDLLAHHK